MPSSNNKPEAACETVTSSLLPGDAAERPSIETKVRQEWFNQAWSDTWAVEAGAVSLCIVCTCAICTMLGILNNRPVPALPKGLTMNAVIGIFSTIAKSSLLLVVSSCISQLKWKWYYQTGRKLLDAQVFEDASRGPLGALQMLIHHRGLSTACIGAVILILALLFEPFVQQVLTYPSSPALWPSDLAMASQARTFFFNVSDGLKKEIPYVVKEAIISGLWFDGVFMPKPICPLSDCSWETFTSMGLCSTCGTANPQARLTCNLDFDYPTSGSVNHTTRKRWSDQRSCNITFRENVTWPVNVNVEWVSSKILADGTEVAWTYQITAPGYAMYPIYSSSHQHGPLMTEYDTIQGVKNPLFAIGIAHFELTNTSLSLTLAEECVVNFCLRDYSMSFTNSTPEVKVSNIRNGAGFWGPPVNLLGADYCWSAEDEDFVTNSSGRLSEYEITNTFDFDLAHFSFCSHKPGFSAYWQDALTEMFWGNLPTTVNMNCVPSTTSQYNCVSKSSTELSSPMDDLTNTAVTDSGVHRIASVGASTVLKNIVDSVTLLNMNTNATIIKGKAGSRVTYVHVRWAWLSLPLLTILVGFAFLAWTIFDTKRHNVPLWKGSILALMFHGFQEGQLKGQIVAESVSGMERMARNMAVTLRENDVEGRTVFTSGSAFNEDEQARKRNTMPRTAVELVLY